MNEPKISEKQAKILAFPYTDYDTLICDGAVRSGKTSIMFVAYIDWAMTNFNNKLFAVCGKTVDSATKNIVSPFLGMYYIKKKYKITYKKSDKLLIIQKGNKTNTFEIFGGKDEASFTLIQGRTLAGIFLDEVVLMPRSFVEQAMTRCSVEGSRFWFSCNPSTPTHWFYEEWICDKKEKNALYLHFKMTDNPSLSEKKLKQYETYFKGVFYQRYVLGEWVMAEGLVYPNFGENNISDETPWLDDNGSLKGDAEFYITIDYGIVNPFAAYLCVVYNEVCYVWKEYYWDSRKQQRQLTDEEHYKNIEKLAGDYIIQNIIIDPSATSFKNTIKRHGVYGFLNADNDVINGIATTSTMLECGLLKINPSCKNLIKEFGLYIWDEDSTEDSVVKEWDHGLDSLRYVSYTVLKKVFYWLDWTN